MKLREMNECRPAEPVSAAAPVAELVNAVAMRANVPAINAAIGVTFDAGRAQRVTVVAPAMKIAGATIADLSSAASGIVATIGPSSNCLPACWARRS